MSPRACTIAVMTLILVAPLAGCGDDVMTMRVVAKGYGWTNPVTSENADLPVETKLGNAPDVIAGHTIKEIVTDANVKVRGDGKCCQGCHEWAKTVTELEFCQTRVPAFLAQPTAHGGGTDPTSAKPQILKSLFSDWHERTCPSE